MRKKVDPRIRALVERSVASHHRSMIVMIGDAGKDQVVNLHYMLGRVADKKASVLWCYKEELGFSSHRKKRMKQLKKKQQRGLYDQAVDDPFELFVTSTDIRYCYYHETENILGRTFDMVVLQDFEAITPNTLCRTIETVRGGGLVCILLRTMNSLTQFYDLVMDAHRRLRSEALGAVEPRFNERLILSLKKCKNCLVVDDELNVLPLSRDSAAALSADVKRDEIAGRPVTPASRALLELKASAGESANGALVQLAVTLGQAKALVNLSGITASQTAGVTVSLTAGRGRGKSAALGLAIAAAVTFSYSNVFVTAPSPENVGTLFEFLQKGLEALGLMQHRDFERIEVASTDERGAGSGGRGKTKHIVRINIKSKDGRRAIVQYVSPTSWEVVHGAADLLVIDEAAAIPLPVVKRLLGPFLTFISSTISGYEGTGRALSLKLLADLRRSSSDGRRLEELSLDEPVRYADGDPIESWLGSLLCLGATEAPALSKNLPPPLPAECKLYQLDRDALFSGHPKSEVILSRLVSLFVSSHYKNSPNDLLLLSDAPGHLIFALTRPLESLESINGADVYVAIQVAVEGCLNRQAVQASLSRGVKPAGDLIPWTVSQQFDEEDFAELTGLRVVRIATHPQLVHSGYGKAAMSQLIKFCEKISENRPAKKAEKPARRSSDLLNAEFRAALQNENLIPREPTTIFRPADCPDFGIDWVGTCYGVTLELYRFWKTNGFLPVHLSQVENDITGEHSVVCIRPLKSSRLTDNKWAHQFCADFRSRLVKSLGTHQFAGMHTGLALSLIDPPLSEDAEGAFPSHLPPLSTDVVGHFFSAHDLSRISRYVEGRAPHSTIIDLVPAMSELLLTRRLPKCILNAGWSATLLAVGIQKKSFEDLASEIQKPVNQVMSMFEKGVKKIFNCLASMGQSAAKEEESFVKVDNEVNLPKSTIFAEMDDEQLKFKKLMRAEKRRLESELEPSKKQKN